MKHMTRILEEKVPAPALALAAAGALPKLLCVLRIPQTTPTFNDSLGQLTGLSM